MSGFVGLLSLDGAPADRGLLASLTSFLAFRGPDHQDTWCDGPAGLGHATLRTGAEPARERRQPCSLDEAWIAADARIDGRGELIGALEAAGRRGVREASDAELILHAWHAWGEGCAARLLGDFAFAIWDATKRTLFCARDQIGIRQLYYTRHTGEDASRTGEDASRTGEDACPTRLLVFSNTLEAIRQHPGVSERLNESAIADFLLFGYTRNPADTAFADVHSLAPGHCLVCERGQVRVSRYWSLDAEPVRFRRPAEYVERFNQLLDAAVADRLRDVPRAAILLSGGLDSPSIAASAVAGARATRLEAFTYVYDRLIPHDERHWAGMVGTHLGIPIEFVQMDDYGLYGTEDHTPEPIDNPLWALPLDVFRRVAAAGHRVLLCGEGGDASCAPGRMLPALLATGRLWPLARDIVSYWREHGRRPPLGIAQRLTVGSRLPNPESRIPNPDWLNRDLVGGLNLRERWTNAMADDARYEPAGEAFRELRSSFWPWCVLQMDAGWTRVPVEVRYPFFDLRLVRFLLGVPGVPWSHDKQLLRDAARSRLPREVCTRPKTPLSDDPVAVLFRRDGPPPIVDADGALWQFVDRDAFMRAWQADPASPAWRRDPVTRPLSLGRWLAG